MVFLATELVIAVDAMGGDGGSAMVLRGLSSFLQKSRKELTFEDVSFRFLCFGQQEKLEPKLSKLRRLRGVTEICHAPEIITPDMKPAKVLRGSDDTSMSQAIQAVRNGEAHFAISAGNTGALMVLARKHLKMIEGISRPAIASSMPSRKGQCIVLDLGANVECTAEMLVQFALMGAVYARQVLEIDRPLVGLMNVGAEQQKGHEAVRKAGETLRDFDFPGVYYGFVEGNDIAKGTVDVVVTDGFTGNVLLKTAEGTARLISDFIKQAAHHSWWSKMGFLMAKPAFRRIKKQLDPRLYNGAMFLGLKGICIKSHGGADHIGFANAVKVGAELALTNYTQRVTEEITEHNTGGAS